MVFVDSEFPKSIFDKVLNYTFYHYVQMVFYYLLNVYTLRYSGANYIKIIHQS